MKKLIFTLLVISVFFSCSSDDDVGSTVIPSADYENGILVVNEGPFNNGSGSITYISDDMPPSNKMFLETLMVLSLEM